MNHTDKNFNGRQIETRKIIIIFLCIAMMRMWAQNDSGSVFRLNLNAAFILNKAFSNIKKPEPGENGKFTPADTGNKVLPGFTFGADLLIGRKENFKGVFGLSFSRTSAEYHFSSYTESETSRPGYTELQRQTEYDHRLKYSSLNFHAGVRHRLYGFFLTTSFVVNRPLRIVRTTEGTIETVYTNNSGGRDASLFLINEETVQKKGDMNLSLRMNLEYQFELGESLARVYVFRNFGLIYTLPWWGIGFSYSLPEGFL